MGRSVKMNDKIAHSKLKKIQEQYNGYKDSRRERCESHKMFAETVRDLEKASGKKSSVGLNK